MFEKARKLDDSYPYIFVNLALAEYLRDNTERGLDHLKKARELLTGHDVFDELQRLWIHALCEDSRHGLDQFEQHLSDHNPPVALLTELITDAKLLVSAPHPPKYVSELLDILNGFASKEI